MLNFIYYPVSAILWFWHKIFGLVFGASSGASWALGVIFLVFTLRAVLFKPFVGQVRSMRKMQEFQPQIKKLQEKYKGDRQKLAQEMQKLQQEHGVNPLGGCLPLVLQVPVFIGLYHVLRSFNRPGLSFAQNIKIPNYIFSPDEVRSFLEARLFGAPLSASIRMPQAALDQFGSHVDRLDVILVSVPLMIVAAVATHITARHSVARQSAAAAANPQAAIMNKVTQYVFPLGVLLGPLVIEFPIAILLYWLSNNVWTLGQQYAVYKKIESEERVKKTAVAEQRQSLAPRPGQKPVQPKPGQKPARPEDSAAPAVPRAAPAEADGAPKGGTGPASAAKPGAGKAGAAKPSGKSVAGKPVAGKPGDGDRGKAGSPDGGAAAAGGGTGMASGGGAARRNGASRKSGTSGSDAVTGPVRNSPGQNGSGRPSGADGRSGEVPGIISSRSPGRRGKKRR